MTFDEILTGVLELLQREGRVSYRALKKRFDLDDDSLEAVKEEIIEAKRLATDERGKVLVWIGGPLSVVPPVGFHGSIAPVPSPRPSSGQPFTPEAERRQLTVMFCDLVGSTALSGQLDPEELQGVLRAYQEVCAGVISRFDGHIAQYLGDGLLVYFGYPTAHEDDGQRAVRAGLGIVNEMQRLNTQIHRTAAVLQNICLQVRIGIHTGLVVVGEMGGGGFRDPMAIVGEAPNIAARLQGIAEPDTVVVSAATRQLIEGFFKCQDYGLHHLKGVSSPVLIYRVVGESEVQSRFEASVTTTLTPLIGREQEVELLAARWERAKGGEGQVVLVSGEPGIGKSRLVQELKERVGKQGTTHLDIHCSPYYQNTALYPVVEHLQRLLRLQRDDAPQGKLQKLTNTLAAYQFPESDAVPLLAALLSLSHPAGYPPLSLSSQKQKQKTLEVLVSWLREEAARQPVLVTCEDLQWADPSTVEFLTLCLDLVPTVRMLALLTFRLEFHAPWKLRPYTTQITLSRLGRRQVEEIVKTVTGGKTLPVPVMRQVVSKTDGVPLFVEELTKMVMESGLLRETAGHYELTGPLLPLAIPATLQDSLMARLDRLAPVKQVAQLGAALGREFSYELIRLLSPFDETTLQKGLTQLVEAELVYQQGLPPQATYIFKHALVQDAAYQSLLKSKRQPIHQQIAQVLEGRFSETRETQPELLAHHYTEAGLLAQAIPYWQRAGERAVQRSAHVEAISHFTKGLMLLQVLPDTPERVQQELLLQISLGSPLMATKGWGATEVERAYARARELCQRVGETPQLFPVLWGMWGFYVMRAQHQTARRLAEQCLSLAQSVQDRDLLIGAHVALGCSFSYMGEFVRTREHLEQGMLLYNPQQHSSLAFLYGGQDPGVTCLSEVAQALWYLGYPDQALTRIHEAVTLAQQISSPFSLGWAVSNAAWISQYRGQVQAILAQAEQVITLSLEQEFPLWLAMATFLRGWALAEQGEHEEGIRQMRQGLATWQATGGELARPTYLALLAETYGRGGQIEEGLGTLTEAFALIEESEERLYEAELYRLKGVLTLQSRVQGRASSVQKEAEKYFHKAIEIARNQQAKSLELRVVMSLARLWQSGGKRNEARQILADIYGWFTEGFDTADLQQARTLLAELS